jgi:ubiquitin carboxyl-terminal hydrolase 8
LLDGIHEDLNRIEKKPYIEDRDCDGTSDEQDAIEAWKNYLRRDKSLVVDIFQGQLRSKLQCLTCRHANIRFEPFMYLSLPISNECHSIEDCLDLYVEQENMVGVNQWYCSKCKQHRDATKKTDLWILPPILIVHLKRFRFNDYGHIGFKNNANIRYPIQQWDLSKFVLSRGSEPPLYDLYAVSNHVGDLGGGHYTACAKNRFDDQWYEFNDSSFRAISELELQRNSSSAYLLFYNRSQGDTSEGSSLDARMPLIRRQSVNRPDLWPHTQVMDSQFRNYSRKAISFKIPELPFCGSDRSQRNPSVKVQDSFKEEVELLNASEDSMYSS